MSKTSLRKLEKQNNNNRHLIEEEINGTITALIELEKISGIIYKKEPFVNYVASNLDLVKNKRNRLKAQLKTNYGKYLEIREVAEEQSNAALKALV